MNQSLALGVAAAAACCFSPHTFAETIANQTYENALDEVVVVANRAPEPLSAVGNSVTVIDSDKIKDSQSVLVSDLLARTPGISFARNGGVGQPSSIFIRGADSDQTVVLIDGVQLNDPSTTAGGFNFANLITGDIRRIEILRGAQSTLYGSQAIGGVINIMTNDQATGLGGAISAEGGSQHTKSAVANLGSVSDALQWRLAGNWYGTGGISAFDERFGAVEPDASHIGGGSGMFRYEFSPDLRVDLRGYYTQARTDFDGYDTPHRIPRFTFGDDSEYGKTKQSLGYAGVTLKSPDRTLTNRVAFQYTNTETHTYDPYAPANEFAPSTETFYGIGRNEREEYQGTWEITPRAQAVFGAQHERSTSSTDSPAFDLSGPAPLETAATINSGYLQIHTEVYQTLTLTAGERYDRHDVYGGHTTGALAAAWALNENRTILRSSFGQGFKAPSLYQLYSSNGSLALRPETARSFDAGVDHHAWDGRVLLSAIYFQRQSHELIGFIACPTVGAAALCPHFYTVGGFGGYYANIARAAAHGVELQASVNPTSQVYLSANYTLTATEDQSPNSSTHGNELPRRPRNVANATVGYRWPVQVNTSIAARYSGRSFDDPANSTVLGGYVLVDARASYEFSRHVEVYGRVENATGKHYETAYAYGSLGRVAFAGIRANF